MYYFNTKLAKTRTPALFRSCPNLTIKELTGIVQAWHRGN